MEPFRALTRHLGTGEDEAISMSELAERMHMNTRQLRKEIERARIAGVIIASSNKGYFIPVTDSELINYYVKQNSRNLTGTATIKAVKKKLEGKGYQIRKGKVYREQNGE